ncbi:MAG: 5-formyltetrahydrofolate cyclo-ligase [Nitrospiraceae bacterium]|nr:MAG: 5-formyltetrahydrofolate cyclo-ligase [Nitrospiraceae bacterium]
MKKELRKKLLEARDSIGPDTKTEKEAAIRERLYATFAFRYAENILLYASFKSEVATFPCIQQALRLKKTVVLPRVDQKNKILRLFKIDNITGLEAGYMGIPEPKAVKRNKTLLSNVDLVIIPGVGFDIHGNRLGYGAGYYDRLLQKGPRVKGQGSVKKTTTQPVLIALAFEEQIVSKVPGEEHDVKMDKIITEKRTIDCRRK